MSYVIEIAHIAFMALVLASLPLSLLFDEYKDIALALAVSLFAVWFWYKFDCPLTHLENKYRKIAGLREKKPDFITYHLREMRIPFTTSFVRLTVYPYVGAVVLVALLA